MSPVSAEVSCLRAQDPAYRPSTARPTTWAWGASSSGLNEPAELQLLQSALRPGKRWRGCCGRSGCWGGQGPGPAPSRRGCAPAAGSLRRSAPWPDVVNALQDPVTRYAERGEAQRDWIASSAECARRRRGSSHQSRPRYWVKMSLAAVRTTSWRVLGTGLSAATTTLASQLSDDSYNTRRQQRYRLRAASSGCYRSPTCPATANDLAAGSSHREDP